MYLIQKAPEGQECHQKVTCLWEEQRQNQGSLYKLPAVRQSPHTPDLCWALGGSAYMATLTLSWFAWFRSSLASDLCLLPCFANPPVGFALFPYVFPAGSHPFPAPHATPVRSQPFPAVCVPL